MKGIASTGTDPSETDQFQLSVMPKNVAFILPNLEVGGTEVQVALLAQQLRNSDFVPHILCLKQEGALAESVRSAGVPVLALELDESLSFKACYGVRRFCLEHQIELVQTFLFGMEYGAVRGAQFAGVPAIVTSRREIPDWREARHIRVQRMANKRTDFVVCNSKAVRDFICEQEKWPVIQTRVIYNGFPDELIPVRPVIVQRSLKKEYLRPYQIQDDELVLGCIANFSPVKNHYRLLDALRQVLLEGTKVRLVLIGDGPIRAAVESYAEQQSLRMATVFLGSRMDRLKFLSECDALILPSLNEGCPNAVLEAMALGVPVIASQTGGIPEMITHGESGWLFDPTSVSSIARAIWTAMNHREDAMRCASRAQDVIRERFTASRMVSEYQELYREIAP